MSEISIGPVGGEGAGMVIEPKQGPGLVAQFMEALSPQAEREAEAG